MLTFTRSFKYMQLLTWHSNLVCVNCGCLSFCNTKTTIIFLTDTIPNHWCTLVLHVADEYLGCIYCVWIVDFNTIPNKWKAFVRYHIDAFVWQSLALNGNKYYKFWVCFWSLCYPTCKARLICVLLCCRPWPLWRHCIFPQNLINGTNS